MCVTVCAPHSTVPLTHLDDKMIQRVLAEYKIHNCELLIKEDVNVDDLIDVIEVTGVAGGGIKEDVNVDDVIEVTGQTGGGREARRGARGQPVGG